MNDAPRQVRPATRVGRAERFFNSLVAALIKAGISVWGSRILAVRGRSSGRWRTTPVNLLTQDGDRYLVAPRGQSQWVRNLRVAGGGELRLGRRIEAFTAAELTDDQKPEILSAYLRRWKFGLGGSISGAGADAPDSRLLEIAPGCPVFRLTDTSKQRPAAPSARTSEGASDE